MQINNFLDLRKILDEEGIVLSFVGSFSQEIIEELGSALKVYLKDAAYSKKEIYELFSVFIEQTQNIKNYAYVLEDKEEKEDILDSAMLVIVKEEDGYSICSGNLVREGDVDSLKKRLDKINSLDKEGLKKLYRKRLKEEMKGDSIGAGLGLIEMSKRAKSDLEYNFIPKDGYYYFNLDVLV